MVRWPSSGDALDCTNGKLLRVWSASCRSDVRYVAHHGIGRYLLAGATAGGSMRANGPTSKLPGSALFSLTFQRQCQAIDK
jgi:hypothetical protein